MKRLDQCQRGMCEEDWSIYMDQLKILDERVALWQEMMKAEINHNQGSTDGTDKILENFDTNDGPDQDQQNLGFNGFLKIWNVKKSDIDGIDTAENSSDLFQMTRFAISDFYKARAHG